MAPSDQALRFATWGFSDILEGMREGAVVSDKYRILRKIGEGGMGSVWIARNEVTEREFAIKFMSADFAFSDALTARFLQEAKLAGRLRHPSLLEIFDAGIADELEGAPFLVMELLDGISLEDAIKKAGKLPVGMALEVIGTVARAMSVVHDKGIVHRDLKPANVFMHRTGTGAVVPKVLDFGISKVTTTEGEMKPSGLTQTGYVLGSPMYMSPEQAASDKTIDARSDIHALGVLFWECLVGSSPFGGDNYNTLVVGIMATERPALEGVMPAVSRRLAGIVGKAFAIKREDRYQTASALADAIDAEMDRMRHVRVLDTRSGADTFFGLLERGGEQPPPSVGSSTTSAHAVPARSTVKMASDPSREMDVSSADTLAVPGLPMGARSHGEPVAKAPASRRFLAFGLGALLLVVLGVGGAVWRLSVEEVQATVPVADSILDPVAMPPEVEPAVSVAPPAVSSSPSADLAGPTVTVSPTTSPKPSSTRTASPTGSPTPKPSPSKTSKPVHHGVQDDGL
jgi:serine/threonine-protein kinase